MKKFISFSLNNKFALWIITIIVLFAGLNAGMNMKMETIPDITIPIVNVTTIYPGAAPEEVMDKITKPIEQRTRNLAGVNKVSSTSFENASSVIIEYTYETDMEKAAEEVKSILADLPFPQGVQDPDVSRISMNAFPVLSISLSNDNLNLEQLTKQVTDNVLPTIQGLEGIADVQISGQNVMEAELTFDPAALAAKGLTEEAVKGIIQASALSVPLGIFEFGNTEKSILVDGNITTVDDLNNLVLIPGVKLSDVSDLTVEGKAESISRTNGKDSIGINIVKSADANTVDVVNLVKEEITDLEAKNEGLSIKVAFDQGEPIEASVHTMISKAIIGALCAVLIIMLFLRNIRSTIISVVSIPLSILIAMLALKQMDITLNIMTLGAITVAIGRVIDDSIVVIENVYRRMSLSTEKLSGKELILDATREMFVPIMASTVVTVAVFLPLGFVSGMVGEIFLPFALTVVFALAASLIVAITVVPMMAHMMFRNGLKPNQKHEDKPGRLALWYKGVLEWSLNHKFITFGGAVLLLIGSLLLTPLIGFSMLPADEQKALIITYNPAPGETREQVEEISLKAEKILLEREGVTIVQYAVGGKNPMNPAASKQALFNLSYDKKFKGFADEQEKIVPLLQELGGTGEWKKQDFSGGAMGGSGLSLFVYGPDMKTIQPVVEQLTAKLKENPDFKNIDSSLSKTYEQYRLVADRDKLSQYGLTAGQVAMALSPVRDRPVLTTIEKDGEQFNVYLKVEQKTYKTKADLENVDIMSPLGMAVKLKDVVKIEEGESPNTITRQDDRIYAEVSAEANSANVAAVSKELQKTADEIKLPGNVDIEMGGVTEQMTETFTQLGMAMLAAVAIVYLVLVLTFGGALTPLTILFSLPFTVIGALIGLLIAGETISATALIGALMLIGIVVTNAIVLIDRVIHKEQDGLTVRDALLEAGVTRLRPILMTAIATVGALLPLAFGFESGGLISKGMAITVIGGLTSSTLLTLIIVPIVYEFLNRKKLKKQLLEKNLRPQTK
ncbi:efflux RND transporter permease subunit [Paenibacillus sp. GSMTC-2017]|uniref:efflux RND transporter permease subunit n=1 Tax=Paenibacillus sp. GSMTC-2017 TaxID=2794350 RepID=UPI0018D734A1|nr:efflux RND transporter permease subunit [Paenibacillus sp. GSMTC-2017]MBH5316543.1 efflux RND transporter permease subunit [Paenibacillus sp. GSMTC-2017]